MNKFIWAMVLTVGLGSAAHAASGRDEILAAFEGYSAVLADFKSSYGVGLGKSGKTHSALRAESETFRRQTYLPAVKQATILVCDKRDKKVLAALLAVAAPDDTTDEPFTEVGKMFECQPAVVAGAVKKLKGDNGQKVFAALERYVANHDVLAPGHKELQDNLLALGQKIKTR